MKFKSGDQVVLKSGSPKMTVIRYEGDDRILCSWMANGKKQEETFHEVELQSLQNPFAPLLKNLMQFRK
jgi:uncharacterized protein YodC (DUF2158 family)